MGYQLRRAMPASLPVAVVVEEGADPLNLTCTPLGPHALGEWRDRALATSDVAGLAEVIQSWDALDPNGNPLPLTPANIAQVLDSTDDAATKIVRAYLDANAKARAGN